MANEGDGPSDSRAPDELFDDATPSGGFGKRVARGGLLTAVSQGLAIGLNLVVFPILSRLLGPEDIGLVAMSSLVTGLASLFVDSGLSTAAIQSPRLSRAQASNLFWCNLGLAALLTLACLLLAPAAAWVFEDERLIALISVSAISLLLLGAGVQHMSLLRRRMQFGSVAAIAIVANVTGQACALGIAWAYGNYWALVARIIAQALVTVAGAWLLCHWIPNLPRFGVGTRALALFGTKVAGSRIVFQLSAYADTALLGIISTPAVVGQYDRAFQLLLAPIRQLNGPLGGVMLPTLSRCIENRDRYRNAFLSVSTLLIAVAAPMAGLVIAVPEWVVALAMGPGWEGATPLFRIVGVGLAISPLYSATSWLFTSQDRPGELLKWQTIDAVWRLVLLSIGAFWGVTGVVVAVVVRLFTMPHAFYYALGRLGPIGLSDYLKLESAALGATAVAAVASHLVRTECSFEGALEGIVPASTAAFVASTLMLLALPGSRGRLAHAWRLLRTRPS